MKNLSIVFLLAGSLLLSCGSKELSKEDALRILEEGRKYPRVIDYDIHTTDSLAASNLIAEGLDTAGLIVVGSTQASSIIRFTAKATPYLLPNTSKQESPAIQKVKVAGERVVSIKEIIPDYLDKTVYVIYITEYNPTPFSILVDSISERTKQRAAHFTRTEEGWELTKGK